MNRINAKVTSNKELMPGVFLLSMTAHDISPGAIPGQFIMVDCGRDFTLRRPISIHGCRENGELDILFRITGKGTAMLSRKIPGETVNILGPLGNGFSVDDRTNNILMVAGGMGIAPIKFLAERCLAGNKRVILLHGAASKSQLYPLTEFGGLELVTATDDGTAGKKGIITDFIREYTENSERIYACGPVPMYNALSGILKTAKVKEPAQVSLEVRMGCGFGICYGCTIKTSSGIKQVCTDGPVFNIDEIDWEWLKI